ncbi:hypothetical protein FNV43_RR14686 [Rhamnella rubrinervis]|uniref:THH1/TOM1/TOM3 domain-containing protein n=1 Tax=Rhamnella rubrinervis TaxID=2594499 RepID=A0A8K0H3J6_9ROSA|nr:hypothetical protein FNV43_RR14686 [Rhamnella rubrinervis]
MVLESVARNIDSLPLDLFVLNIALASLNGFLAAVAFCQLVRMHMRNREEGWTRQKVLHFMIGTSNLGYVIYFISTVVASCQKWLCWYHVCGFILMAYPKILFLSAFLLLLSFWVDLCHQAKDDEDDDSENRNRQALLENSKSEPDLLNKDGHRSCCSFESLQVGSHQKFVIVVVVLVFILMVSSALIIWIGSGKNPIDSAVVARVYEDFLAIAVLLLGVALGCYGLQLILKLRKVRSEKASSEMWKVVGLAVTSVVCFTSSALVALFTDIPLYYHWHLMKVYGVRAPVFLIVYYFIGSLVPSAFVLWIMRELPPPITNQQKQSRIITFVSRGTDDINPPRQGWASATSIAIESYIIIVNITYSYLSNAAVLYLPAALKNTMKIAKAHSHITHASIQWVCDDGVHIALQIFHLKLVNHMKIDLVSAPFSGSLYIFAITGLMEGEKFAHHCPSE